MNKSIFITSLLVCTLILGSCTPPSLGIFWALEKEKPVPSPDKGLAKELPVSKVYRHDSSRWVAQGSKLFVSDSGNVASRYTAASIPGGYLSVLDSESVGAKLFATFVNDDGSALFYSTDNGQSWAPTPVAGDSTHKPWDILTNGTRAFIVNMEDDGDRGFYDGEETFTIQEITTPSGTPGLSTVFVFPTTKHPKFLVDIGTIHLITNNGVVYEEVSLNSNDWQIKATENLPDGLTYTAITQRTGPNITAIVSTNGTVSTTINGTAWATSTPLTDDSTTLQFTSALWPNTFNNYFDNRILVGTAKTGLYYISLPSGSAIGATARALNYDDGNYYSTNSFKQSPITSLAGGTASLPVMVGTSKQGLWSGLWDSAPEEPSEPGIFWTHE